MQRNEQCNEDKYPVDLFDKLHLAKIFCNYLQRFVLEARSRREDGTQYPPKTGYQLLTEWIAMTIDSYVAQFNKPLMHANCLTPKPLCVIIYISII